MIARAELSTNAQIPQGEPGTNAGMNVALIGPNDTHRQIVARALASSQGRKVHEFIDYPHQLSDVPRMFAQSFDFVLVDVDTDESYALQIIEKLSEIGQSVMAYSARSDQELLMACMRAGARDFLPLPTEGGAPASPPEPVAKPVEAAAPAVAARTVQPPAATPVRSNVTPIIPEKQLEPVSELWPASDVYKDPELARLVDEVTVSEPEGTSTTETLPSEFAEWDAAHLRRDSLGPIPTKRNEARPRPALVPERTKVEPEPRPVATFETPAVAPIERPPVAVELFRSSTFTSESDSEEGTEKQGANWIKWILIAAGPLVLALVLLVVFTRSSTSGPATIPVKGTTVPASEASETQASTNLTVKASAKSAPGVKAEPDAASAPDQKSPETVSSAAMAAQLVAPSRIAGQIKKTAAVDEPPPSAPAAVVMDDNSVVPGAVFGAASKVKVDPHVVGISAGVAEGMILHRTQPVYPKFAQDAHLTGKVVLKATITPQGNIEGVQVLSGAKILAPSAVEAVKTWKYRPYKLDGQPVSVETNITIVFGSSK